MSADLFWALALFVTAMTVTPGPNNTILLASGVNFGFRASVPLVAGICFGLFAMVALIGLGLGQIFETHPWILKVLSWAGGAYMLYLAWKMFRAPAASFDPDSGAARYPIRRVFFQGLLTNLLNPKMALFVLALFPQFVTPGAGSVAIQILVLATVLNAIGLVVNGAVIVAASRLSRGLRGRSRVSRWPNVLLGTVFAGLAAKLAFDARS